MHLKRVNHLALGINHLSTYCALFMPCKICAVAAFCLLPLWLDAQQNLSETLAQSSQMVVVTTKKWTATDGTLRRFERTERGWEQFGPAVPVVVGRSGLGWGLGLNPASPTGPQKKEGDGRSPAGIFRLTYAFGYAPPEDVRQIKLPYIQCTSSVECVDDTNSAYYNIIVDRHKVAKVDWKSSEKMRMSDDEYKLGVFVAHNASPTEPGAGSCVFMHIWKEPGHPTSGCTAMSEGSIDSVAGWLDARSNPVLVQLPQEEYLQKQTSWGLKPKLPDIPF
jgi:D-alanyl-D-alanine dipeptidase